MSSDTVIVTFYDKKFPECSIRKFSTVVIQVVFNQREKKNNNNSMSEKNSLSKKKFQSAKKKERKERDATMMISF